MGRKNKRISNKNKERDRDEDDQTTLDATTLVGSSNSSNGSGGGGHVLIMDQSGSRLDGFIASELGFSRSRGHSNQPMIILLPYC